MTVAELKALLPLADCYELRPDAKYLVVVNPGSMPSAATVEAFRKLGIEACLLFVKCPLNTRAIIYLIPEVCYVRTYLSILLQGWHLLGSRRPLRPVRALRL